MDKFPLLESGQRYDRWLSQLRKVSLLPRELLIDTIAVPTPNEPTAMMRNANAITPERLAQIKSLAPWGYSIPLGDGHLTGHPDNLERFLFRAHLIGNAVAQLTDLKGASVLDMACNHGYFALHFANEGAHAKGVDLRPQNIEKAEILKSHFGVDAEFEVKDVYDLDEQFDVVLNLGLLYHVTDPYMLVKRTYDMCGKIGVVDTITHHSPVSAFIQRTNKNAAHHAEGKFDVEYHPTYRGLLDLMHAVGFKDLVEVIPEKSKKRATNPLYERFERRCIIGFK